MNVTNSLPSGILLTNDQTNSKQHHDRSELKALCATGMQTCG